MSWLFQVETLRLMCSGYHFSFDCQYSCQDGAPVTISASINLRNILGVGEKEQIISLETTLRLYWKVTNWKDHQSLVQIVPVTSLLQHCLAVILLRGQNSPRYLC